MKINKQLKIKKNIASNKDSLYITSQPTKSKIRKLTIKN